MFLTEFDEDTWRESMKEEGREEGREEGLRIFITSMREINIPKDVIKSKLKDHYHLTDEEAEGYLIEQNDVMSV